jgi:hypothetical protein
VVSVLHEATQTKLVGLYLGVQVDLHHEIFETNLADVKSPNLELENVQARSVSVSRGDRKSSLRQADGKAAFDRVQARANAILIRGLIGQPKYLGANPCMPHNHKTIRRMTSFCYPTMCTFHHLL